MATPLLQALLLADHVYQDAHTGKKVIAGTFNKLILSEPPPPPQPGTPHQLQMQVGRAPVASVHAFLSVTEVSGTAKLTLRFVDLSDDRPLLQTEFTVTCADPLQTVEIAIPLPPLPVPRPGVYAIEVLSENQPLGSLRVTAEKVPPRPPAAGA